MKQRVFVNELGDWPKLYRTEKGYLLEARYLTPGMEKLAYWINFFLALGLLAIAALVALAACHAVQKNSNDMYYIIGGFIMACIVIIKFLRRWGMTLLENSFMKTARLHFEDGGIWWRGGWLGRRVGIDRDFPRQFVVEQHRQAAYEERKERRALRPQQWHGFYQDAKEVVIRSGFGGMHRIIVAAIARDIYGDTAGKLRAALEFADKLQERRAEDEQARPGGLR